MKFSEQWLREWVNTPLSRSELTEQLTMAGLEIESVLPVAQSFAGVVVGEITSVVPHPNADNLHVCQVNVGDVAPLTIVCGAGNVRVGMRAPVAIVGAQLPNGTLIKQATLRAVDSHGMLCSAQELGLGEDRTGLLEMPQDTRLGEDVYEYLKLDDVTIELSLTPNRGDCLSLAGLAREVGALARCAVQIPATAPVPGTLPVQFAVKIEAPTDCPRYVGRVIKGIQRMAKTPLWIQERLRRSGLRSITPVVDITNYVMLELGQPMHAFDLAQLQGSIIVRHARPGEKITLLDGQTIPLTENTLVIADQEQAQAIAGIMGGTAAAISDITDTLFLESAFFAPQSVSGRARSYGLSTESSFRFERGVDPALPRLAMERATTLLLEIVGGKAGPVIEVTSEQHLPTRQPLSLRAATLQRLLGMVVPAEEVSAILTRLGMAPIEQANGWRITPPCYRFDITSEVDLIEEIARVYGYHRLPARRPKTSMAPIPCPESILEPHRLRQALVERGYQEVITYSFVDPALQRLLDPQHTCVALANPLSSDMSVMRTTLWCGLLQSLLHNVRRQQPRIRIFEYGLNFMIYNNEIKQENYISGVLCGSIYPEQWGIAARAVDFYDAKADVEVLLALTANAKNFSFTPRPHPALHPGQSALIECRGEAAGWLGALHPQVLRELGLDEPVYLFELKLAALGELRLPRYRELSKFPVIRRDIAMVVDETLSGEAVRLCAAQAAPDFIQELQLFDVYRGKGVDLGRKSIALGLTLQAASRTLTDEEADAIRDQVIKKLNIQFGAVLRG
jgi:phenylalanyl-tRNA synthetase beta chain